MALHISPDLSLPLDAVTETFAILAVKRAGKSNAAVVMAEEMYDAQIPWVAVDPKGDWWGVRAAGDGQAPGLSVLVFGGLHGDVPLEPTAGNLVADLIAEQRVTCVLDVSEMSKADQRRFLTDFAGRLYRRNTEPLHVFCEEADEYIPQRVMGESAKLVGAFETLVKRGGFRGIGVTLITQRSASLNKDVLTQAGTLIAMRTPSPQDRKAVLAWIDYHAASKDVIDELPTLPSGTAWLFSSGEHARMTKLTFRRRRTFDSGATPKVGGKPRPPARLADVDLAAIKEAMADTIERAKADDPRELRKRIKDLEGSVDSLRYELGRALELGEAAPVEVPVITDAQIAALEGALAGFQITADSLAEKIKASLLPVDAAINRIALERGLPDELPMAAKQGSPSQRRPSAPASRVRPDNDARLASSGTANEKGRQGPAHRESRSGDPAGQLDGPQQRVLDAVAWLEEVGFAQPTKIQTGFIAGYRVGKTIGGRFGNILGQLRSAGLIEYPSAGTVELTADGRAIASSPDIDQSTDGLQQAIYARLAEPERRVLVGIVAEYPNAMSKQEAGERGGYTVGPTIGGRFGNILGKLRSLGLVDYPAPGLVAATEVLFLAGDR